MLHVTQMSKIYIQRLTNQIKCVLVLVCEILDPWRCCIAFVTQSLSETQNASLKLMSTDKAPVLISRMRHVIVNTAPVPVQEQTVPRLFNVGCKDEKSSQTWIAISVIMYGTCTCCCQRVHIQAAKEDQWKTQVNKSFRILKALPRRASNRQRHQTQGSLMH